MRTWTLAAFTGRFALPTAVRLKYNEDNEYFAELVQSQVKHNGKGFGEFVQNGTISNANEPVGPSMQSVPEGSLLKYVDHA